jgi:bifunctional ADP-heptose synthase (sugar kinase/adenylyltransferase)
MDTVEVYGGRVEYVNIVDGCSTTNIVKKIETILRRN